MAVSSESVRQQQIRVAQFTFLLMKEMTAFVTKRGGSHREAIEAMRKVIKILEETIEGVESRGRERPQGHQVD